MHDHEALKALYGKLTTSDEHEKPTPTFVPSLAERREAVMTRLWQRMGELFGNQWELNFGKAGGPSYRTWMEGLADYSELQLKNGLEQCRTFDSGFVPNLPQFARLCLTHEKRGPNFTEERIERERDVPLLEKLKRNANTPIAQHELARILRILDGEHVETRRESWDNLGLSKTHGAAPAHWE